MKTIRSIFLVMMIFLGFVLMGCEVTVELDDNEAQVKSSSSSLVGTDYEDVVAKLESWGFTNIQTEAVYDIIWGITKEGTTKSVKIGESETFASGDVYDKDVSILVTYSMKASNDPTNQKYSITWQYEDGTIIKTENVLWGNIPSYTGDTPYKESTNETKYTFGGWTPEVVAVTGEKIYTAVFTESEIDLNKVDVMNSESYFIGKNYEEVVEMLQDWGFINIETVPVYDIIWDITEPGSTKDVTINGSDKFINGDVFDKDVLVIVTYSMRDDDDPTKQKYSITWQYEDGSIIKIDEVLWGQLPTYTGETPTKTSTPEIRYVFNGWTPAIEEVNGEKTYVALFIEENNDFTIIWKNDDGTVLETDNDVMNGIIPEYNGLIPLKTETTQYSYEFIGWSPNIVPANGNTEYIAIFKGTIKTYTITWIDSEDNLLETDEDVEYGSTPSFDGVVPIIESTQAYTYSFGGWSPEVNTVTGNQTYKATLNEIKNKYSITIDTNGGELENTEIYFDYGTTFYSLAEPQKLGFVFTDWTLENETMAFPYTLVDNIHILANYREMLPHELIWDYFTNISLSDRIVVNDIEGYIEFLSDDPSTSAIYNNEGVFGFYYDLNGYEFVIIMDLVNSKFNYFDEYDYYYERDFLFKSFSGNVSKEDYIFIEEMFVVLLNDFENEILKTLSETYGKTIEISDFNEDWDELVLLPVNHYMTYEMEVMNKIDVYTIGFTPVGSYAQFDYYVINNSVETIYYLKIEFAFYVETSDGNVAIHKEIITYYTYLVPSDYDEKIMNILLSKLQDEFGYSNFDFMMITVLDVSF